MPAKTETELLTLPSGHPQAGYVSPDLSFQDGVGTLPPEEADANQELHDARQADADAVAEHEDKVARAELAVEQGPQPKVPAATAPSGKS